MKRMTCIGAQAIAMTELTAPRPVTEMQCRRDNGDTEHRTFFVTHPIDDGAAMSSLQLPLFEDPDANDR